MHPVKLTFFLISQVQLISWSAFKKRRQKWIRITHLQVKYAVKKKTPQLYNFSSHFVSMFCCWSILCNLKCGTDWDQTKKTKSLIPYSLRRSMLVWQKRWTIFIHQISTTWQLLQLYSTVCTSRVELIQGQNLYKDGHQKLNAMKKCSF